MQSRQLDTSIRKYHILNISRKVYKINVHVKHSYFMVSCFMWKPMSIALTIASAMEERVEITMQVLLEILNPYTMV